MAKQKNKSHKKKRIAKHILQARKQRTANSEDQTGGEQVHDVVEGNSSSQLQKYIRLGQQYLSGWDHQRKNSTSIWKFHKNTQTWLLRNMYYVDRVPKASFQILMEYMEGLKGDATREWVNKDAIRRVLRYKEWEKLHGDGKKQENEVVEQEGKDDMNEKTGEAKGKTINTDENNQKNASLSGSEDDEKRFQRLSDHDKRKEYKRARKVLEALKKQQQQQQRQSSKEG